MDASNASSPNGRASADAWMTGAAEEGRLRIISAEGSTAVTSRSGGSYEPAPAPTLRTLRALPRTSSIAAAMRESGLRSSA